MYETRIKRALFAFAHPDDETLGAGGLIARLRTLGVDCYIQWACEIVKSRDDVAEALSKLGVGIVGWNSLGRRDQSLTTADIPGLADDLRSDAREWDLVVTHLSSDLNHDHGIMRRAVEVAFRPNRSPGPGPWLILGAEIPTVSDQPCSMRPPALRAFARIEDTEMTRKAAALKAYGEGWRIDSALALMGMRGLSVHPRGAPEQRGAEAFEVIYLDLARAVL